MTSNNIPNTGLKACFLIENGFCEREFLQAQEVVARLGGKCVTISTKAGVLKGWRQNKGEGESQWGAEYVAHDSLSQALPSDFDMLIIPGGQRSIEKLILLDGVTAFIRSFLSSAKPVVVYNRAIEILVDHNLVQGYSVAATSLSCDVVKDHGGRCAAPEFVVSKNLVTLSRYRDVGDKMRNAVESILAGRPYVEKVADYGDVPQSHKAA